MKDRTTQFIEWEVVHKGKALREADEADTIDTDSVEILSAKLKDSYINDFGIELVGSVSQEDLIDLYIFSI